MAEYDDSVGYGVVPSRVSTLERLNRCICELQKTVNTLVAGTVFTQTTVLVTGEGTLNAVNYTMLSTANTYSIPELSGKEFIAAIVNGQTYNGDYITLTGSTIDLTDIGGGEISKILTVFYK